jgi:hypothetical protein
MLPLVTPVPPGLALRVHLLLVRLSAAGRLAVVTVVIPEAVAVPAVVAAAAPGKVISNDATKPQRHKIAVVSLWL